MVGRLYLCAPAVDAGVLRAALSGGVDVVQLRDHALDDGGLLRAAEVFRAAAEEAGALFVLNDRPDLAARCGAGGVHVGQEDATPAEARAAMGPGAVIGRSTRAPEQAVAADVDVDVDYLSIGPVWPTPTKPGRPAAGLEYVRWAAEHVEKPWFAIGGVDERSVRDVVEAGAARVVVVRAILEAADPAAVAARLRASLEAVGSGRA